VNLLGSCLGGELFRAYVEIFNQSLAPIERILRNAGAPWFAEQSRGALVALSLAQACDELSKRLGPNARDWRWGDIHKLRFSHPLDAVRGLNRLLSIQSVATGGDGVTLNLGFFRRSLPYAHTVGASLRMIADLRCAGASLFVAVPGQSGHFFSPHYADQLPLWRDGRYLHLENDQSAAAESRTLILEPL
jgi:penicillin amidase